MRGARDRQELRQSLDDAEQGGLENNHSGFRSSRDGHLTGRERRRPVVGRRSGHAHVASRLPGLLAEVLPAARTRAGAATAARRLNSRRLRMMAIAAAMKTVE